MTLPTPTTDTPADATATGDATPTAGAADAERTPSPRRARLARLRWPVAVVVVILLGGYVLARGAASTSETPLAPDNPGGGGTMALAQVLGDQGVRVRYVRSPQEVARLTDPGSTLLVTDTHLLDAAARTTVLDAGADLVLVDPDDDLVTAATGGAVTRPAGPGAAAAERAAGCDDPRAVAAGSVVTSGRGLAALAPATGCFAAGSGWAYATHVSPDGRRTTALTSGDLLTNANVTAAGNAALALHVLGAHDTLVWFQPLTLADDDAAETPGALDLLPGPALPLGLLAIAVVAVTALWRGRRFGPLVPEPLPVVVRSAEVTRGRARLYRRGRAYGHAGASLRAGAADRMARRLGLPRSADAPQVVGAVSRAVGRPAPEISAILYGPPPADDAQLLRLSQTLDQLESEVDRS